MKCQKCNSDLPEDSKFCQYCGAKIERSATEKTSSKSVISDSSKSFSAQNMNYKAKRGKPTALIILSVILCVSLIANIFQFLTGQERQGMIADLESKNSSLQSSVSTLGSQVSNQSRKITALTDDVEYYKGRSAEYDELISSLRKGNLGYAAYNFQADQNVIVVRKNQTDKQFTLTAYWSYGGTVTTTYSSSSPAARVSFDGNSWNYTTVLTVTPVRVGATAVTFSNSVDSNEFQVIIIVTN